MLRNIQRKLKERLTRALRALVTFLVRPELQRIEERIAGEYRTVWATQKDNLVQQLRELQNPRLNTPDSFRVEFEQFSALHGASSQRLPLKWEDRYPCLNDRGAGGAFDRHYVFHTAWAARVLGKTRPFEHVDIGSWIPFVTNLSAFIPVRSYDFNRLNISVPGLETGEANLLSLPFESNSISSLSCMHVLEHVGLGRYGDPWDADGDLRAMKELARVLAVGGNLLVVFPMGRARIEYNAHRIYDLESAHRLFEGLKVQEFVLIPDDPLPSGWIENPSAFFVASQSYACGCFLLTK